MGRALSSDVKAVIFKVAEYFKKRKRDTESFEYKTDANIAKLVAEATGCCEKTVRNVVKAGNSLQEKPPSRKMSAVSEEEDEMIHEVKIEYDDSFCYEDNDLETYEPQEKRLKTILAARQSLEDNNDSNGSLKDNSCQTLLTPRIPDPLGDNSPHPVIITRIPNPLGKSSSQPLMTHQGDDYIERVDKYKAMIKNMPQDIKSCSPTEPRKEPRIEDCFDSFGNYVAAMLKNMPVQRAIEIQPEIVQMLVSGIIDNKKDLNNPSGQNEKSGQKS